MTNDLDTSRTSHKNDPGWKHCHLMDETNLNTTVCNYCGKVLGPMMGNRIEFGRCKKIKTEVVKVV